MNKIFRYIGILSLLCFSFFLSDKTTRIAKEMDEIMIKINEEKIKYEYKSIDAIIENDNIIPGKCGLKVNINKSYNEMKKIGLYDYHLFQYDYYLPKINLKGNKNKYIISGNHYKNNIYIFIELNELNRKYIYDTKFENYNFIVNYNFFIDNYNIIEYLIRNNNSILIKDTSYKNYKNILKLYKKLSNKNIFCYSSMDNFLDSCSSNGSYTIKRISQQTNIYLSKLKNGSFINLELSNNFLLKKDNIEKYIIKKGFYLTSIENDLIECEKLYN